MPHHRQLQLIKFFPYFDKLQIIYGDKNLSAIYGAGCIIRPKLFFVFMNPTAKNISSKESWQGIRAPWLGTKHVWKIFSKLKLMSDSLFNLTQKLTSDEWTNEFALQLYTELADNRVYVTNLAKCTKINAKPLRNSTFNKYMNLMISEIRKINPAKIITFGNLVSSRLLGKNIKVSRYGGLCEELSLGHKHKFKVYPVHYPVGQGMRNIHKAIEIIERVKTY